MSQFTQTHPGIWMPGTSYVADDYIEHEGVLYRCLIANIASDGTIIDHITIAPTTFSLYAGDSRQLIATVYDSSGNVVTNHHITWASGDDTVAVVSDTGVVLGIGAGTTTISASVFGIVGSTTTLVSVPPIVSIQISPTSVSRLIGESQQMYAHVYVAGSIEVFDRPVTWLSDNPSVVSISASGVITALTTGTANIIALCENVTSNVAVITVTVPVQPGIQRAVFPSGTLTVEQGTTISVKVLHTRDNGQTYFEYPVVFSPIDGANITLQQVSPIEANITGVSVGSFLIRAADDDQSGFAIAFGGNVVLTAPPIPARMQISPTSFSGAPGSSVTFAVSFYDGNGTLLNAADYASGLTFNVNPPQQGTLTPVSAGMVSFTAHLSGTATLSATYGVYQATAPLNITASTLAVDHVTVVPAAISVNSGGPNQTLTAHAYDVYGNELSGETFTWVSGDGTVVTVGASGQTVTATGVGSGSTTITVTCATKTATVAVTGTSNIVDTIVIAGTHDLSPANSSCAITSVCKDRNGAVLVFPVQWQYSQSIILGQCAVLSPMTGTSTSASLGDSDGLVAVYATYQNADGTTAQSNTLQFNTSTT